MIGLQLYMIQIQIEKKYSGKYTDHNENKNGDKCNIQVHST